MKRLPQEPPRILDLRTQDDPAHVARLVRSALQAPEERVPRLSGRIRRSLRAKSARRHRCLRAALLGGAIFLTGGVMGAVLQPALYRWQQQNSPSVMTIPSAGPAARSRQRRVSLSPSRTADQDRSSTELADPPGLPPALPLAPPTSTESPAAPHAPSVEQGVPPSPRAESARARPKPSAARAAAPLPALGATPSSTAGSVSPAPARASAHGETLRTALLEPPSLPPQRTTLSLAESPATPLAPPPQSPQPESKSVPTVGNIGSRPPPTVVEPKPLAPPPPNEQALLSRAVRSLRFEHSPGGALTVLDEYVARFPNGSLRPEATRLRTEALLALGHKPAALAELNRAPASADGEEGRLVRAELRAGEGRWREALEDFEAVVGALARKAGPATPAKLRERFERALWGRASARGHLGDEAGARADLRECLRQFPQGRFAGQAARLLGELR